MANLRSIGNALLRCSPDLKTDCLPRSDLLFLVFEFFIMHGKCAVYFEILFFRLARGARHTEVRAQ